MFTIEWARSASEYRSRTWTALSPSRRAADAAHAPGETQMMLRTQWDPFEDLRGAQDELREMSPALAHALGLDAGAGHLGAQGRLPDHGRAARRPARRRPDHHGRPPADHPGRAAHRQRLI